MNKELEALNDIQFKLKENCKNNQEYIWLCEKTNLIEVALKRLPELEKAFETLSEEDEKTKKLLSLEIEKNRALEIIKENVLINVIEMQGQYFIKLGIGENVIPITKEKALILKEALL